MSEYIVASVDELAPNECKSVDIEGIKVAVFHIDSEYYAIIDQCPHRGASLSEIGSKKIGEDLIDSKKGGINSEVPSAYCPWHHWEWDLKTGENVALPKKRARTFDTKVDNGKVKIVL